ncbi:MAG TPA: hypothetical protein VF637_13495, partial [Sphingomicrobium sp.]
MPNTSTLAARGISDHGLERRDLDDRRKRELVGAAQLRWWIPRDGPFVASFMLYLIKAATAVSLAVSAASSVAQSVPLGANLERFDYPAPVQWFVAPSQGQPIRMAYIDIAPS